MLHYPRLLQTQHHDVLRNQQRPYHSQPTLHTYFRLAPFTGQSQQQLTSCEPVKVLDFFALVGAVGLLLHTQQINNISRSLLSLPLFNNVSARNNHDFRHWGKRNHRPPQACFTISILSTLSTT